MNKKIALVTGVSREMGLGFEIAKQLQEAEFEVIISARNLDKALDLAKKNRRNCQTVGYHQ